MHLFQRIISNFAAVKVKTRRHIASWVLLAVFLPMLIMSSVHVHETTESLDYECSGCVQHHCHGHIAQLPVSMHACVLCQFVSLPFLAAVIFAVVFYNKVYSINYAQHQSRFQLDACGIITLRAPPVV